MSVTPVRDTHAQNLILREEIRLEPAVRVLAGAITLPLNHASLLSADAGGAHRDVTLPAVADSKGLMFVITNWSDAAENLVVKNVGATTIITVAQGKLGIVVCDGVTWFGITA